MKNKWLAGIVKRYHTWPILGEQSIAAHSWGVTVVLRDLWPDCSRELLVAALDHDILERFTGDMPTPTKWQFPELADVLNEIEIQLAEEHGLGHLNNLSAEDAVRLRIADLLELCWFARYQIELGNAYCDKVLGRGCQAVFNLTKDLDEEDRNRVMRYIDQIKAMEF